MWLFGSLGGGGGVAFRFLFLFDGAKPFVSSSGFQFKLCDFSMCSFWVSRLHLRASSLRLGFSCFALSFVSGSCLRVTSKKTFLVDCEETIDRVTKKVKSRELGEGSRDNEGSMLQGGSPKNFKEALLKVNHLING